MDLRKYDVVDEGLLKDEKGSDKKKSGRRMVAEEDKRKNRITLNLTDSEYEQLMKSTDDLGGIPTTTYLRMKLKEFNII